MSTTGSSMEQATGTRTLLGRFNAFRERYRVQVSIALAVLASLTFILGEAIPVVHDYVLNTGIIQYIILLVLLDLAVSVYLQQRPPLTSISRDQDESMSKLIAAVPHCRDEEVELLEYAGQTTLPLIRAIRREAVPLRLLVKHPDTVTGMQKQRMITTLDTLYNSIFENYKGTFEIRCYRLPYTLRGRRLGKETLELGWLTPDIKRETAYGHANPSVLADLSHKGNEHLRIFFERTFRDLWEHSGTEDGRAVLNRLLTPSVPSSKP